MFSRTTVVMSCFRKRQTKLQCKVGCGIIRIHGGVLMAMISCPECERKISDQANICVNCGFPVPKKNNAVSGEKIVCVKCRKVHGAILNVCPNCSFKRFKESALLKPKCPTCQSTQIQKITFGSKVVGAAVFGSFAIPHAGKTFECSSCGYKW